jgi:DNA-binding NtrC family response regulator/tetratricopeptide (TPR) repeat protein
MTSATVHSLFQKPNGTADPERLAKRWRAILDGIWRSGNCHQALTQLEDAKQACAVVRHNASQRAAADLYYLLARAVEACGEFDEAQSLLNLALGNGDSDIEGKTLADVKRLRARITLNLGRPREALEQARAVDHPVFVRAPTLVEQHHASGRTTMRLDRSEAGEIVKTGEGRRSVTTALLEAEILMVVGDYAGFAEALDYARRSLLAQDIRERTADDQAMLMLWRLLDPRHPAAGSVEILGHNHDEYKRLNASAAALARYRAAAGMPADSRAINAEEERRYRMFGARARTSSTSPAESRAASPTARPAAASGVGEEDENHILDLEDIYGRAALINSTPGREFEQLCDSSPTLNPSAPVTSGEPATTAGATVIADGEADAAAPPDVSRAHSSAPVAPPPPAGSSAEADPRPFASYTLIPGSSDNRDLFSLSNTIQEKSTTGQIIFRGEGGRWARITAIKGRFAFAEHSDGQPDPVKAFKEIFDWTSQVDEPVEVTILGDETLDTRLDLLTTYPSNLEALLAVGGHARPEGAAPPPQDAVVESSALPPPHEPAVAQSELSAVLSSLFDCRDLSETVRRLAEAAEHFGATSARASVLVGERTTIIEWPSNEKAPPRRKTIVETPPTSSALRVRIEAETAPQDHERLGALSVVARAARAAAETLPRSLREERELAEAVSSTSENPVIWRSSRMFEVTANIHQLAAADGHAHQKANVFVTGETGTGKELAAHLIHSLSGRRDRKMVSVNVAAVPLNLAESILFGHRRGAFTDAREDRVGIIEQAHGSTLFLDEIADCPPEIQTKLLRAVEYGEVVRLGETEPRRVGGRPLDVRWVLATDRPVNEGSGFRQELWHRCPAKIHMPPLRDRREDIPPLAKHFSQLFGVQVSAAAVGLLEWLDYPGNVRDLRNLVQMAALKASSSGGVITPEHAFAAWSEARNAQNPTPGAVTGGEMAALFTLGTEEDSPTIASMVEGYERMLYTQGLKLFRTKKALQARSGLAKTSLYRKLAALGLDDKDENDV